MTLPTPAERRLLLRQTLDTLPFSPWARLALTMILDDLDELDARRECAEKVRGLLRLLKCMSKDEDLIPGLIQAREMLGSDNPKVESVNRRATWGGIDGNSKAQSGNSKGANMKRYAKDVWICRDLSGRPSLFLAEPERLDPEGLWQETEEDAGESFLPLDDGTYPDEAYPAPGCARKARLVLEVE